MNFFEKKRIIVARMNFKTYRVLFTVATALIGFQGCAAGPAYQMLRVRDVVVMPEARVGKSLYSGDRTEGPHDSIRFFDL